MTCGDCTPGPEDAAEVLTAWQPDEQLIAAILAAPRHHSELASKTDKCWVVAGLTADGWTAEDIRDRLKCSLRLVRTLIADPRTKVFLLYLARMEASTQELALVQHELRTTSITLAQCRAERDRVKRQRDNLIDAAMTGEPIRLCKHGHLLDKYNTYEHPATGKKSCRTCRRKAKQDSRNGDTTVSSTATVSSGPDTDVQRATAPSDADEQCVS